MRVEAGTEVETIWRPGTDPHEGKWPGFRIGEVERVGDMEIRRDIPVAMRDGVTIYVDVFLPAGALEPLPTLFAWSPYGKHAPKTFDIFPNSGVPAGSVSKYAAWEGPDPVYWTGRGFAVVNGDARGSWGSEGDCEILGPQEAVDGYDTIEWIGEQAWCNGRVALAGVSYLAIVQWKIAELNPPHLACINPWEGYSDTYREYFCHGGIPETNFVKFMEWSCRCSLGRVEDWVTMHETHPLYDAWNASKNPRDFSAIKVPAYVVADWGDQGLHTRGTLQAFSELGSEQKWLEVHGRKKWQYYYQQSSLARQEAFYRKFLLDEATEVDSWPNVQIEVRDRAWEGTVRAEQAWPLLRATPTRLYLDGAHGTLGPSLRTDIASVSYDSDIEDDHVDFVVPFESGAELTGSMRLRLWVASPDAEDMDLFIRLDKLDVGGNVVPFVAMAMLDDGPLALGWLRVSHRELDVTRSTESRSWLQHRRQLPLRPGEIVPVDIEIWPSSTRFLAGESLRLRIQGNDAFRYDLPQAQLHQQSVNAGVHRMFTGGPFDSYLVAPVVGS